MPFNATVIIAVGGALALSLGAILVWAVRRSAYSQGVAVAENRQNEALLNAQLEGDKIVAMRRDPHDVAAELSDGEF